jgi:hypothetical protein
VQPTDWDQPFRALRDRISMLLIWPYFSSYAVERENMESTVAAMNSLRSLAAGSSWLTEKKRMADSLGKMVTIHVV